MGVVLSGLTRLTGCDPYSKFKLFHRTACGANDIYVWFGYGLMGTASDLRPCKPKLHVAFRYSYAHGFYKCARRFYGDAHGFYIYARRCYGDAHQFLRMHGIVVSKPVNSPICCILTFL